MRSVNKVILIGNLTRDPEMRQTPNNQSVTTFGLATNRYWVTREGDQKSSAEFHECVAWANLAEICSKFLKKGNLVYVEGYLKTRSWDSPEGVKKFKTEIVVQDMIRLEKRSDGGGDDEYYSAGGSDDFGSSSFGDDSSDDHASDDSSSDDTTTEAPATEAAETPAAPAETAEAPAETPAPAAPAAEEENPIDKDLGL